VYRLWKYTGGGTSGTMTFANQGLPPGTYEARAYYDWAGTQSFTIQQRSASFTIGASATMLAPSMSSYANGASVPITFSGFTGSTTDWIAIFEPGAPDSTYVAYQYTGGGTSGTLTFSGLAQGSYEARYFPDFNGTHQLEHYAVSPTFIIGGATNVTTDLNTYGINQTITVSYTNLPGNQKDWIAISPAGSPATTYLQWFYTNGQVNGSQSFTGLPAGNYEARAYVNDTFTILATHAFVVSGSSVTTDGTNYNTGDPVTVTYAGLPGNQKDWIAVSLAGSADTAFVDFVYTAGAVAGTAQFDNLPPGTYEARAYENDTFTVLARSASFTIGASCSMPANPPVFESMQQGDLTITEADSEIDIPMTVAMDRSILFSNSRAREASPFVGAVMCWLHDADADTGVAAGLSCRRYSTGTDSPATSTGEIQVHWSVVTFTSGVTVQRGVVNTFTTNPLTVALTTIDPAKSFVLLGGQWNSGSGWGSNEFVRAQITSATALQVDTAAIGTNIAYQVVSVDGASVQRGTASLSSGQTVASATITTAPSGSLVLASYTTDNASGISAGALMVQSDLATPTSVQFSRYLGGSNINLAYEVVSLPFATYHGTSTFGTGVSARNESVPGIDPSTAVALASSQAIMGQAVGSTSYAGAQGDLVGEGAFTLNVGADSVSVQRASSDATATVPWTVVDFALDCAGN
jgi:hypothetical protein